METTEMMKKMATTCKVLNNVLRDVEKYEELTEKFQLLQTILHMLDPLVLRRVWQNLVIFLAPHLCRQMWSA